MTRTLFRLFFFLLFAGLVKPGFSQQTFQRLYGGVNQDISLAALPCPTGGIYYLGATTSAGSGDADPVLMKLDDDGQVIWARTIGGAYYDVAGAMVLAADGGIVCAGSSKSFNGNSPDDLYFFKTDSLGNMVWSETFSTSDLDVASAVYRTADDGFAITGFVRTGGLKRVLLIRTDANGDTLFTRSYGGGTADDQGVELTQTADGGFLIIGKTFTQSLGESDILLMRTDASGNLLWAKSFGELHWDEGAGITYLADGNLLLSGSTISFGQGDFDMMLLKTDTAGNPLWGRTYGGPKTDAAYTARENPDGSIVLSGYTNSMGYGHALRMGNPHIQSGDRGDDSTNIILMKVDAGGDTIWTRSYGDGAQDEAFHFYKMADGGYLIPGFTTSYTNSTDSTQMLLVRTDSAGISGCHEQDAHPVIDTTNFITQNLTFSQWGGIGVNAVVSNSIAWTIAAEDACLFIKVDEPAGAGVTVYPNPASGILTITGQSLTIKSIDLFNLLGESVPATVFPVHNSQTGSTINVSSLQPGIYILKLRTSTSEIIKKIIIQKN